MKLSVVAENNPAFCADCRKPFVVGRVLRELEFVSRIVVIFDGKGRPCRPDSFWKALPEVSIKIER
jgi:hypothetical protein